MTNILLPSVEVMPVTITDYLRNFNIPYNVKIGLSRWLAGVGWVGEECSEPENQGNCRGSGGGGEESKAADLGICSFKQGKLALISLIKKEAHRPTGKYESDINE